MFGFGGSTSKSKSTSSSQGEDFSQGSSFDIGGTYLDPYQQARQMQFQDQFSAAMPGFAGIGAGNQQQIDRINQFQGYGASRMNEFRRAGRSGAEGLAGLQGGLQQYQQGAGAAGQFGMNQLGMFAQQNNPYLQSQISQFGEDIGRNFREQILPGIGSQSQMMGQRGSSRQGIAEGLAAQGAQNQFQRGVTDMRMNAYGQQQQAAGQLGALGQAGYLGAGQQQLAGNQALAQYGLGGVQAVGNQQLGAMGLGNEMYNQQVANYMTPFQIGSSIFGAPQALSFGIGGSNQSSYGYDTSKSKSTGSSAGVNMGFS